MYNIVQNMCLVGVVRLILSVGELEVAGADGAVVGMSAL